MSLHKISKQQYILYAKHIDHRHPLDTHTCVRTQTHPCVRTHTHTQNRAPWKFTRASSPGHIHIQRLEPKHTHIHIHPPYTHTHTHTHTHTRTHTHTHAHTHTHTRRTEHRG